MTKALAPTQQGVESSRRGIIKDVFSAFTFCSAVLGAGAGIWAAAANNVLSQESVVLLALGGASVGLLAVTVAAMPVVMVFLSVTTAVGVRRMFRPFVVVAVVSGSAALCSFAGAIDSSSGPSSIRAALFGAATWLFAWAILGAVGLVRTLVNYADYDARIARTGNPDSEA